MSKDIEYSVKLINGDNVEKNFITVVFDSKQTKESFIKSEIKSCKVPLINRQKAITQKERDISDKELNAARVQHATNKGYKAIGYEGKRWFYNPVKPDNIFA